MRANSHTLGPVRQRSPTGQENFGTLRTPSCAH